MVYGGVCQAAQRRWCLPGSPETVVSARQPRDGGVCQAAQRGLLGPFSSTVKMHPEPHPFLEVVVTVVT
jgi:hypothetical protein